MLCIEEVEIAETDTISIREAIVNSEFVEGPAELYELVERLWPELLHKVKPPRKLMH